MRRRYIWSPEAGKLVEVPTTFTQEQFAPMVMPDLPGYQSPVTGLWVEGRKQRREDLKRTNSRPFEGIEQERKEAQRRVAYQEQRFNEGLERAARQAYHSLPPEKRRILENR
jgi:hypothetical protein